MRIAGLIGNFLMAVAVPGIYVLIFIRLFQGEFEESLIWYVRVWVLGACWVIVKRRDEQD